MFLFFFLPLLLWVIPLHTVHSPLINSTLPNRGRQKHTPSTTSAHRSGGIQHAGLTLLHRCVCEILEVLLPLDIWSCVLCLNRKWTFSLIWLWFQKQCIKASRDTLRSILVFSPLLPKCHHGNVTEIYGSSYNSHLSVWGKWPNSTKTHQCQNLVDSDSVLLLKDMILSGWTVYRQRICCHCRCIWLAGCH